MKFRIQAEISLIDPANIELDGMIFHYDGVSDLFCYTSETGEEKTDRDFVRLLKKIYKEKKEEPADHSFQLLLAFDYMRLCRGQTMEEIGEENRKIIEREI